jgi:hypothetical protein
MKTRVAWVMSLSVLMGAGIAAAQEPEEQEKQDKKTQVSEKTESEEAEAERPEPPPLRIRVLENPYDLASFYRSSGGYDGGHSSWDFSDRYPIARFYRQGGATARHGLSRFWTTGYGRGDGSGLTYRRNIGENGDLFLMAPTFLAPVGPLTSTFVDDEDEAARRPATPYRR